MKQVSEHPTQSHGCSLPPNAPPIMSQPWALTPTRSPTHSLGEVVHQPDQPSDQDEVYQQRLPEGHLRILRDSMLS